MRCARAPEGGAPSSPSTTARAAHLTSKKERCVLGLSRSSRSHSNFCSWYVAWLAVPRVVPTPRGTLPVLRASNGSAWAAASLNVSALSAFVG